VLGPLLVRGLKKISYLIIMSEKYPDTDIYKKEYLSGIGTRWPQGSFRYCQVPIIMVLFFLLKVRNANSTVKFFFFFFFFSFVPEREIYKLIINIV
jgi:hypothetical protein